MPGRTKRRNPCPGCRMTRPLCLCAELAETKLEVAGIQTQVIILMHAAERKLTTNTAKLAQDILPQCEIRIRGDQRIPMNTEGLNPPERQALLLYPSEDAHELTPEWLATLGPKLITLVVPDGSWRQARKVAWRESALIGVPRIKLKLGPRSKFRLRKEPHPHSLATFEAIMRALAVIEPKDPSPALNRIFDMWVERSLWGRGTLRASECEYPIPESAIRQFWEDGCRGTPVRKP